MRLSPLAASTPPVIAAAAASNVAIAVAVHCSAQLALLSCCVCATTGLDACCCSGRYGQGLVYSITTDTGVFNVGLNLNLCGMLAILGGPDVMTGAVRTVSLRFNTYNGQCDGLFSSVDITARFTLGERSTVAAMASVSLPECKRVSRPIYFPWGIHDVS